MCNKPEILDSRHGWTLQRIGENIQILASGFLVKNYTDEAAARMVFDILAVPEIILAKPARIQNQTGCDAGHQDHE